MHNVKCNRRAFAEGAGPLRGFGLRPGSKPSGFQGAFGGSLKCFRTGSLQIATIPDGQSFHTSTTGTLLPMKFDASGLISRGLERNWKNMCKMLNVNGLRN
jgi:hypothetical protein